MDYIRSIGTMGEEIMANKKRLPARKWFKKYPSMTMDQFRTLEGYFQVSEPPKGFIDRLLKQWGLK